MSQKSIKIYPRPDEITRINIRNATQIEFDIMNLKMKALQASMSVSYLITSKHNATLPDKTTEESFRMLN